MKPVIGIIIELDTESQDYKVGREYVEAVRESGGLPTLIPVDNDFLIVDSILTLCDGLLFTGGGDFDPFNYSEPPLFATKRLDPERDAFEIALIKSALKIDSA